MMVLNTIAAEAFDDIADALETLAPEEFHDGLQKLLQQIIRKHGRIIFNGDNYAAAWREEAARRGLANAATTMEALAALIEPKNVKLFECYGVFSGKEVASRYEVFLEEYHRRVQIEGKLTLEMARSMILPVLEKEYHDAAAALRLGIDSKLKGGVEALCGKAESLGGHLDLLTLRCSVLEEALKGVHEDILAAMAQVRLSVDTLEALIADERWPLPKYREMLFIY